MEEERAATHNDALVILKLYELRQEAGLREARRWLASEFSPASSEDFWAVASNSTAKENAWFRQAVTYWEMAASMVLRGAVHPDLFLDSNGEGLFLLAKFDRFREEYKSRMGHPFMARTAELCSRYPMAERIYQRMRSRQRAKE